MATKRKKSTRKTTNKKTANSKAKSRVKTKKIDRNLQCFIVIIISILLGILIYVKSGYIGKNLSPMLGGFMGIIKYIVPIGTFFMGISLLKEDKDYLKFKSIQYIVAIMCICSLMTIIQIKNQEININDELGDIVVIARELGEVNKGGGILGVLIAYPMIKLFGILGATTISVGMAIILIIFTFGIKPAELIDSILQALSGNESDEDDNEEEYEMVEEYTEPQPMKQVKKKEKNKKSLVSREIAAIQEKLPEISEQITINNIEDEVEENDIPKGKYKLFGDKENKIDKVEKVKKEVKPDVIEANLFKEQQEQKEEKTKQILQLEHAQIVEDENYEFPPVSILEKGEAKQVKGGKRAITDNATKLQKTLFSFGVSAKVENVSIGPAITRYELKPAEGVRVNKIANLADDIALNLAARSIRIEAPIPGKQAVGIEIPNAENEIVHLRDVIDSEEFVTASSKISVGLGKDVSGQRVIADIGKMPHLLIAGSTGSGKSVCVNTLITSIIYKAKPSEVKLVMVDPKIVELSVYNGIPHLLIPVVTDPRKAAGALAWAVQEMENRYALFASKGVRDLSGYNKALTDETNDEEAIGKLPQIVIIIDELADLMMVAAKDVEDAICRLAQKARAAGMHLVIATQRPSVDVITGLIKANVPSRIAFAVSSQIDSRTILDMAGAEKLLGKGDMLFYPTGVPKPVRVQGAYVSDKEVEKIVSFLKKDGEAKYNEEIIEKIENSNKSDKEKAMLEEEAGDDTDPFLNEAIEAVIDMGQASASAIQRKFKVGYARAGRIIDQMEERGIISGYQGSKPRDVLMSRERWEELKMTEHIEE
jgi:S-DNA-T family DNA segregation ATPase FtsK/SpoIIIE